MRVYLGGGNMSADVTVSVREIDKGWDDRSRSRLQRRTEGIWGCRVCQIATERPLLIVIY